MTTVRHLEKLWHAKTYGRLARELLCGRAEQSLRVESEIAHPAAVAALVLIRLDELNQAHTTLAGCMLRTILAAQESDGGWGDPMVTALCLRALLTSRGEGASLEHGLQHLASLQKTEGIWPAAPIRRTAADPFVSAFVLLQLAREERFRSAVRLADAIDWFNANESSLDPEARRLWDHAALILRYRSRCAPAMLHATLWS